MLAVRRGFVDIATTLLAAGASIHVTDTAGRSPLMHAAATGQTPAAQLLVDEGCQVNHGSTATGQTALMLAAAGSYKDTVSALIACGAFVPAVDKHGMTARDHAEAAQATPSVSIVVSLLSEMDTAIEKGDFETVATLVRNGNYVSC